MEVSDAYVLPTIAVDMTTKYFKITAVTELTIGSYYLKS